MWVEFSAKVKKKKIEFPFFLPSLTSLRFAFAGWGGGRKKVGSSESRYLAGPSSLLL